MSVKAIPEASVPVIVSPTGSDVATLAPLLIDTVPVGAVVSYGVELTVCVFESNDAPHRSDGEGFDWLPNSARIVCWPGAPGLIVATARPFGFSGGCAAMFPS